MGVVKAFARGFVEGFAGAFKSAFGGIEPDTIKPSPAIYNISLRASDVDPQHVEGLRNAIRKVLGDSDIPDEPA